MFFTLKLRPKQPADRLLCLAVVIGHHLLFLLFLLHDPCHHCLSLLLSTPFGPPLHNPPRARARVRIPHRSSPLFPALQPLKPREGLPATAACLAAYQGPASA
eukprot:361172-Chlamydomonas_euryale.AAC.4